MKRLSHLFIFLILFFTGCISLSNYWNSSIKLAEENRCNEAVSLVREELSKAPTDNILLLRYGYILFKCRKYSESVVYVDSAINTGLDIEKAENEAEDVGISLDMIYYKGGIDRIREKDYAAAVDYLSMTTELSYFNAVAQNLLGYSYLMLEDLPKAESLFWTALSIDSLYKEARYNLALSLFSQSKFLQTVNLLVKYDNLRANEYYILGTSMVSYMDTLDIKNRIDEIENYFNLAMEDTSTEIRASSLYNIGLIRSLSGDLTYAQEMFERSLDIDSLSSLTYYNIAVVMMKQNKYSDAKHYFTEAISLEPRFADAYTNRAVCEENLGERENARLDYIRGMELRKE